MNSQAFTEQVNMEMLWDILIEAEGTFIQKNNGYYVPAIKSQFLSIVKNFYEHEKNTGLSLMEMNKKLISILIQEWVPTLKRAEKENQTSTMVEADPILVTVEEIQQNRKSQIEKEFYQKQSEFQGAMAPPAPPVVDFKEKMDEPIGEMEKLIAETIAQRNLEMSSLQTMYPSSVQATKWLQGEKVGGSGQTTKQIKIGEPIISPSAGMEVLNPNPNPIPNSKKHLTWAEPVQVPVSKPNKHDENVTASIFRKLKPIASPVAQLNEVSQLGRVEEKLDKLISKIELLIDAINEKKI